MVATKLATVNSSIFHTVELCKEKLAVVYLIDKSYSIHSDLFMEAIQMVHNVADILFTNAPNVIQGAVIFDGISGSTPLNTVPSLFHTTLDGLATFSPDEDYTNMASALESATTLALG